MKNISTLILMLVNTQLVLATDLYSSNFWDPSFFQASGRITLHNWNKSNQEIGLCNYDKNINLSCIESNTPENNNSVYFENTIEPKLDIQTIELGLGYEIFNKKRQTSGVFGVVFEGSLGFLEILGSRKDTQIKGDGIVYGYGYSVTIPRLKVGIKEFFGWNDFLYLSPKYKETYYTSKLMPLYITGKNNVDSHFYREDTVYKGKHTFIGAVIYFSELSYKSDAYLLEILNESSNGILQLKGGDQKIEVMSINIGFSFQRRF